MGDVTLSSPDSLPKTAFLHSRLRLDREDAEGGCGTAEAEASPILKRQNTSGRHLALIDSYVLSHECIRDSLSQLRGRPTIVSFFSIDECVLAQGADFALIIVYLHEVETPLLQELPRLRKAFARSSLFLITDLDHDQHPHLLNAAIQAGARGFVSTKTTGISLALSAIEFVQAGGFFAPLDPLFGASPVASRQDPSPSGPLPLTRREEAVMALLREGKSNKMIARELQLSSNTVKVHIHNILRKMSVGSRLEAVSKAR